MKYDSCSDLEQDMKLPTELEDRDMISVAGMIDWFP